MGNIMRQAASLTRFQQAVQTYQATNEIDHAITQEAAGLDPADVAGVVFHISGGAIRMAAMADPTPTTDETPQEAKSRADRFFSDKVWPEYMKTATRRKAIEQTITTVTHENAHALTDEELEVIARGDDS